MISDAPKPNNKLEKRLNRLAWLLDSVIVLPGGFRLGLDSIIGLVPVIGDVVSALISTYIIILSVFYGAPLSLVVKMLSNVLKDMLLGAVPLFGDIFDMVHRANYKNVVLLQAYLSQPGAVHRASRWWLLLVVAIMFGIVGIAIWLLFIAMGWVFALIAWPIANWPF